MEEAALSPAPTHTEARPQHFGAQPHHPHGSRARPGGPGPACGEPGGGRPGLPHSGSGPVPLPCPLARMATAPRGRPLTSVPAGGGVAGGEEQDGAQRQRLGAPHAEVVVDLPLAQGVGQGRHLGSSMTTERGRAGGPSGAALGPRGRPRQPPPPAATVPTGAAETSPTPRRRRGGAAALLLLLLFLPLLLLVSPLRSPPRLPAPRSPPRGAGAASARSGAPSRAAVCGYPAPINVLKCIE